MKAWVSLWSADQLALGEAVDALDGHADGFHLDVMDGHFVPELLYGPDLVAAVSARTQASPVDVHLLATDADAWIDRFGAAGADLLTVHPESCADVAATLAAIERTGARPGLALSLEQPVELAAELLERVDRVLLMGTALGIKGVGLDPRACERIERLAALRDASDRRPELVADGGIRRRDGRPAGGRRRRRRRARLARLRRGRPARGRLADPRAGARGRGRLDPPA